VEVTSPCLTAYVVFTFDWCQNQRSWMTLKASTVINPLVHKLFYHLPLNLVSHIYGIIGINGLIRCYSLLNTEFHCFFATADAFLFWFTFLDELYLYFFIWSIFLSWMIHKKDYGCHFSGNWNYLLVILIGMQSMYCDSCSHCLCCLHCLWLIPYTGKYSNFSSALLYLLVWHGRTRWM